MIERSRPVPPEKPSDPRHPRPELLECLPLMALPLIGFFVPWGVTRGVGWVIQGFVTDWRGRFPVEVERADADASKPGQSASVAGRSRLVGHSSGGFAMKTIDVLAVLNFLVLLALLWQVTALSTALDRFESNVVGPRACRSRGGAISEIMNKLDDIETSLGSIEAAADR